MSDHVYRIFVAEKCPVCGGHQHAIYYRTPGIVPWIYCREHGMSRKITRDEHRKCLALAIKSQTAR